jgi:DNA-binding NarL/FixJ family response regulator
MSPIQLLIASDYAMTRDGLRALLKGSDDIEVVAEAESVADTPARFKTVRPDVALVEVSAPGSKALRMVATILSAAQDSRIVILSNIDDPSYVRAMLAVGAFGYVLKQSPTEQLIIGIHKAAENHRFIDPLLSDGIAELFGKKQAFNTPGLSNREEEVLKGIARGLSSRQLAIRLRLSTKTVETYRSRLYHKLQLHNRAELVNYAIALGIITAD